MNRQARRRTRQEAGHGTLQGTVDRAGAVRWHPASGDGERGFGVMMGEKENAERRLAMDPNRVRRGSGLGRQVPSGDGDVSQTRTGAELIVVKRTVEKMGIDAIQSVILSKLEGT